MKGQESALLKQLLEWARTQPQNLYLIHYSCDSFGDGCQTPSPRITSIVIMRYSTKEMESFSIPHTAEELGVRKDDIQQEIERIEKAMLEKYNASIRRKKNKYFVHWNMKDVKYGFEALLHRSKVLGVQNSVRLKADKRLNLADVLTSHFGDNYVVNPKMENLMRLNGGLRNGFLPGVDEVRAYEEGKYLSVYSSNRAKVGFFHDVVSLLDKGKLKVPVKGGLEFVETWGGRILWGIGVLASILGIIAFFE